MTDSMTEFEQELCSLLNRHSIDSKLKTPDFIVARHIGEYLQILEATMKDRDHWRTGAENNE